MYISLCKAKIHRATVTEANLNYEGSLSVDKNLLVAAGILPYEKVTVVNINNGLRLETYAIEAISGSGVICLNGAAARMGEVGDIIIIMAYAFFEPQELSADFSPSLVYLDEKNAIK